MTAKHILTERFVMRKLTSQDSEKYYQLSYNDNVMKYVTGYGLSRAESDKMLRTIVAEHKEQSVLGRYLVEDRFSGALIGIAKLDQIESEVEIGYRIAEEYWGRGAATEIALSLMQFAFKEMGADQVVAYVNVENHASIRVLEKAGMQLTERIEDIDEIKYRYVCRPSRHLSDKKILMMLGVVIVVLAALMIFGMV